MYIFFACLQSEKAQSSSQGKLLSPTENTAWKARFEVEPLLL